jgi:glycerol-3-phosphate acyltransferase PlsY
MAWMEQLQAANGVQATVCAIGAYALGCFATGYYLVRAVKGQDIRNFDSGSVGARNVGRFLGRMGFLLTVLGDLSKGVLAVWAAHRFTGDNLLAALALLCVVTGHIWPVQLRFHGGKGVATSLGALLVYDYHLDHDGLKLAVIAILSGIILFAHRKNLVEEIPALAARRGVSAKPQHPKL